MDFTPLAALLIAQSSMAATNATLTVGGQIVPGSCSMSLSTPNVDYLKIPLSLLNKSASTEISPGMSGTMPTTDISITCDMPTQIAVRVTDNRASTVDISVSDEIGTGDSAEYFGLGVDSAQTRIGAFMMTSYFNMTIDSQNGRLIESFDNGASWDVPMFAAVRNPSGWRMSWTTAADLGKPMPKPMTEMVQRFAFAAAVVPTSTLVSNAPIVLNGSVTMELVYL